MSEICSPSTGRRYSIKRVCAVWQIPRSTVHSQLRRSSVTDLPVPRKRGPVGAASDEELVSLIRKEIDASPFHGEGHRKIWARLRFQGVRTSKDRVRRLMREMGFKRVQDDDANAESTMARLRLRSPIRCGAPT